MKKSQKIQDLEQQIKILESNQRTLEEYTKYMLTLWCVNISTLEAATEYNRDLISPILENTKGMFTQEIKDRAMIYTFDMDTKQNLHQYKEM